MTSWDPAATQTVNQLIAGTGVTLSPTSGQGVVTINTTGGGGGVASIIAGTAITLSPSSGLGNVTINSTGLTNPLATALNVNNNALNNSSNINFSAGGQVSAYSGGTSQGILQILAPIAGQGGNANDGIISIRAGTGFNTYMNMDSTNISFVTPAGSLYLPNTVANGNLIFPNSGTYINTLSNPVLLKDANHGLVWGGNTTNVNIDGPYLFGFAGGSLGTTDGGNNIKLSWDRTNVYIYKTLNMSNNAIVNVPNVSPPTGSNLRVQNFSGSCYVEMNDAGNIYSVANSGQTNQGMTNGLIFNSGQRMENKVFGATATQTFGIYDAASVLQRNVIIDSNGININLGSTSVLQPIIQYSTIQGSGVSGTVTVTLPARYTSQASYLAFANMIDSPAAQLFVSTISRSQFIIGWTSAGTGTQTFAWNTLGT